MIIVRAKKGKEKEVEKKMEKKLVDLLLAFKEVKEVKRCRLCMWENRPCFVNWAVIDEWEEKVAGGQKFMRTSDGILCWACKQKKKKCELLEVLEILGESVGAKRGQGSVRGKRGDQGRTVERKES